MIGNSELRCQRKGKSNLMERREKDKNLAKDFPGTKVGKQLNEL